MVLQELEASIKKKFPDALSFKHLPYGDSIWIHPNRMIKVAEYLKQDSIFNFDWLENLSVFEWKDQFVLSYFLRSFSHAKEALIRVQLPFEGSIDSVTGVWPMAQLMETEITDLFGIRFEGLSFSATAPRPLLPADWKEFPLRKSYELGVRRDA